jgi:hypothetical protein
MSAANGLVMGYIAVKAKTVANADNATKAQAESTGTKEYGGRKSSRCCR